MSLMSVSIPYPTSSVVDVLSILELANDSAKLKKIIKELHEASVKYTEAKNSHEEKIHDVEKKLARLEEKEAKIADSEDSLSVLKDRSAIEASELKKLLMQTLAKKAELESAEKSFESKKAERVAILDAKEKSLSLKFLEVENLKSEAATLVKEYQEKLVKLKAVML